MLLNDSPHANPHKQVSLLIIVFARQQYGCRLDK